MGASFDVLMVAIEILGGIYLIWSGITGKGRLFKGSKSQEIKIKKGKEEEYIQKSKMWFLIMGPLALLSGIASALVTFMDMHQINFLPLVLAVLFVGSIAAYYILILRKYVDNTEEF